MRVLMLTNLYPPYVIGGYEALCQECVTWLEAHGHAVRILTSTYGVNGPQTEGSVQRLLALESEMASYNPLNTLRYPVISRQNQAQLKRSVADFRPDVILVWGVWHLPWSILTAAEKLPVPVAYYLASPWPTEPSALADYWNLPAQHGGRAWIKRGLAGLTRVILPDAWHAHRPRLEHAICNTISLRDQLVTAGYQVAEAAIICEGIDLTPYQTMVPKTRDGSAPLELVFIGRLGWHKGPHTIIEAMDELINHRDCRNIRLTICGGGQPDYKQHLAELVEAHNLAAYIRFQKPIPRAELPAFLGQFDALVLSSIWDEALARIMQEAMAAARVLIATTTGSTKEFVVDGETGLAFPPGDAICLADQIARLLDDPQLGYRLASAGQQLAFARFDTQRMMAEVASYLQETVASADRAGE